MRINFEIRAKEVRLIGDDGSQMGVLPLKQAIEMAEKSNLDVVEVNPSSYPPVCRLIDYGKFKYKQTKKEREAKKKQHVVKVKEIKIRPQIDEHDYLVKLDSAKKFLEKGNKVKLTLIFRGREITHKEIGETIIEKFCQTVVETKLGAIESQVKLIGKLMTVVLAPTRTH